MLSAIRNLKQDESGQDLIEYALIAALLALAAVATMTSLGTKIQDVFTGIDNKLVIPGS